MHKKPNTNELMTVPRHLSKHMRSWVASICDRYEIEPQHFEILVKGAEAWDRCEAARAVLSLKGISYRDRFNAPRARPEVAVERDSRIAFVRCLAALALENEMPEEKPRPRAAPTIPKRGEDET
jgi:hypothetical protein